MFTEIGQKIMRQAKYMVIGGIVLGIIGVIVGLVSFVMEPIIGSIILPIAIIIPLIIYVISWFVYAFGQMVDDTAIICRNSEKNVDIVDRIEQLVTLEMRTSDARSSTGNVSCGKMMRGLCDQCGKSTMIREWSVNGSTIDLCENCMAMIRKK